MSLASDFISSIVHQNSDGSQGGLASHIGQTAQQNPLVKLFLGTAMNTAHDIGAGVTANMTSGTRNAADTQAGQQASSLENQATAIQDPAQKKALLQRANSLRMGVSNENQQIASSFSPDIRQNYGQRALESAVQIGTGADMISHPVATVKAPFQIAKGMVKGAKALQSATGADVANVVQKAPGVIKDFISNDLKQSGHLPSRPSSITAASKSNTLPTSSTTQTAKPVLQEEPIDPYDVQKFTSQYTIPTKRAGKNDLNTLDTSTKILQHVKSGMTIHPEEAPELITGENGLSTQLTNQIVKNMKQQIPIEGAAAPAEQLLDSHKVIIDPTTRKNIIDDINRASEGATADSLQEGQQLVTDPTTGEISIHTTHMTPEEALTYARDLEKKGALYGRKDTYLTPDPKWSIIKQAYYKAADTIMENINKGAVAENAVSGVNTPENISRASQISPLYGRQVGDALSDATAPVDKIRSTAAPFVKYQQMIDLDKDAKNSAFGKVAKGMEQGLNVNGSQVNATQLINHPVETARATLGNAIGGAIDKRLAPVYEKMNRPPSSLPPLPATTNGSSGIQKTAELSAPVFADNSSIQNQQPVSQNGNMQNTQIINNTSSSVQSNKPVNYNAIPTDVTHITADYPITPPNMIMDKTSHPIAMSESDYTILKKQYQDALKSPAAIASDFIARPIQQELAELETTHTQSTGLQSSYQQVMNVNNAVTSAQQLLANAPTGIFNQNGLVDNINTLYNGKYAGLKESLSILQKYYPVLAESVLKSGSPSVAQSVLSQIPQRIKQDYYQAVNIVTGNVPGNTQAPAPTAKSFTPPPPSGKIQLQNLQLAPLGQ